MRRLLLLPVLIAALVVVASAQAATTLYAAPTGPAAGTCTEAATPCELQYAISLAQDGDTIELAAGTYSAADGYNLNSTVTLRGAAGGARPEVKSTTAGEAALDLQASGNNASGSTLEHVAFSGPTKTYAISGGAMDVRLKDVGVDTAGLCIQLAASSVEDSTFKGAEADATCASLSGTGTVKNSSFTTTGASLALDLDEHSSENLTITSAGRGMDVNGGTHRRLEIDATDMALAVTGDATITDSLLRSGSDGLRAIASTATVRNVTAVGAKRGIIAQAGTLVPPSPAGSAVNGINVIARGATAEEDAVAEPKLALCIPCEAGTVTLANSNLRTLAGSGLVLGAGMQNSDPQFVSASDLHLKAESPARNAGSGDGVDSTVDVDGDPRVGEGAIDIGGDEFTPAVEPTPTASPSPTPTATPTPDRTRPRITRTGRAKRGRVTFTMSEAATVKATILRKARKRFRRQGTQTFSAKAGANKVKLFVKGKALRPGRYRIRLVATDAAGNASRRATIALRIRR